MSARPSATGKADASKAGDKANSLHAKTKTPAARSLRQSMSDLHTWAGLLAGWVLYAMFLTGTVSYFRVETSAWLRPELPRVQASDLHDQGAQAQRLVDALGHVHAPDALQWNISLATARNPVASARWSGPQGFGAAELDAATGQKLHRRDTQGGDFFYRFHYQLHYFPVFWGRWIASLCAMFMLVALISGVITHKKIFADFFTFRWGKGQRSWLDAHNGLAVLGLPFHFMITYSGLVTLMMMLMPWGEQAAFSSPAQKAQAAQTLHSRPPPALPRNPDVAKVALAPIAPMIEQARAHWGGAQVGRIRINNPGQASARIYINSSDAQRLSVSAQYLEFDGTSGQLLKAIHNTHAAAQTRGVLYALHMGRFADHTLRWLYFLTSLAGTAMVGTGLLLWTVKRRARLANPLQPHFGFWLVERLNIAAIAGLSVAMSSFFWLNRLLPLDLPQRSKWEINGFFILWGMTLAWAVLRPAKRAWVELLSLAALLLALLPVLNALTTQRHLLYSVMQRDWTFVSYELTLLAFAALHAHLAWRTARHQGRTGKPAANRPIKTHSAQTTGPA